MYSVSFRIPFKVFNTLMYYNSSCFLAYPKPLKKGSRITVQNQSGNIATAEVIDCQNTNRDSNSYSWSII